MMSGILSQIQEALNGALVYFSAFGSAALALNILALIFSKKIYFHLVSEKDESTSIRGLYLFRSINIVALVFIGLYKFTSSAGEDPIFRKVLGSIIVIYLAVVVHLGVAYLFRRAIGEKVGENENLSYEDTPKTRNLRLISATVIFSVSLISIINIFDFNSLLEAGGVVGFIGFIIFIVQPWILNDLVSGFIISGYLAEKDVIELDDKDVHNATLIWKLKLLYTELIDLQNNHRVIVGNHLLRKMKVHNLSRNMPSSGLRENLSFKIGYDESVESIKLMFEKAFQKALKDNIGLNETPIEVRVIETGDHAVEWGVFYYTKNVRRIMSIKQKMRELILIESADAGISLATPITHKSFD